VHESGAMSAQGLLPHVPANLNHNEAWTMPDPLNDRWMLNLRMKRLSYIRHCWQFNLPVCSSLSQWPLSTFVVMEALMYHEEPMIDSPNSRSYICGRRSRGPHSSQPSATDPPFHFRILPVTVCKLHMALPAVTSCETQYSVN
jgi:hypothetical protein